MNEPQQRAITKPSEGDDVLSFGILFRILWERLWIVTLVTVVLVGMVVGFSLVQTPQYQASIKILVGQDGGISRNTADIPLLQDLTLTMTEAINSRPLAEAVIQELDLQTTPESFLYSVNAQQIPDTLFIEVTYTSSDPVAAKRGADTIGRVFADQVSQDMIANNSTITASVWEEAIVPSVPASPNPVSRGMWALVLGGMLGTGLALLLEYLDDRWRSPEEAEAISRSDFGGHPGVRDERQINGRRQGRGKASRDAI